MKWRVGLTVCLVLAAYVGLNYYIGWHGRLYLQEAFGMERSAGYWVGFWIAATAYLWSWGLKKVLPFPAVEVLKWIGAWYFGLLQYAVILLPTADIAALLSGLAGYRGTDVVILLGSAVLLVLLAIVARGSWNAWNPIIRRYDISVPKPAAEGLATLRIAAASDLHLGSIVRKRYLSKLADKLQALNADLVLFPGDILDDSIEPFLRQRMGEVMSKIRAPYGVYAVLGNHEYIGGHIERFIEEMRRCGVRVLTDEVVELEEIGVTIAGRKDRAAERFGPGGGGGRMPLAELLRETDKSKPLILLDHQPYELGKAEAAGVDLMLSGHTHRGQMAPNHLITRRLFELDWGYLRKGGLHAIVSSGYGSWGPPLRLGSRSEILAITVSFEK